MVYKGDYKDYLNYDAFKRHVTVTEYTFILFPRKCHSTNKWLWLEFAYKQTAMFTGPGDPIHETRWYDKHEYLIWFLKK